ncbi:MAG: phenylalanine--tRNA ligase subunit alpha, partial [Anaerolineae bacterium]|nr:phenylalanine--tRNA ligase subunit alpha [Anaerolineae bacterium]
MLKQLDEIREQALAVLEAVPDLVELDAWRIKHLGKKSALNQILRDVGKLPREERPAVGRRGNEVKVTLEAAYDAKKQALERGQLAASLEKDRIDVTLPG